MLAFILEATWAILTVMTCLKLYIIMNIIKFLTKDVTTRVF
jgi:hypothetical protein